MKEGRKLEYPEKTPDDVFQKMPHTKAQTLTLHFLVPVATILNSNTKSCQNWPNFVLKFDLLKVLLWLTKDEKQTVTYFRMCIGKAVHVLQLKPTQLVWCGVV